MTFNQIYLDISRRFLRAYNDADFNTYASYLSDFIVYESPRIQLLQPNNFQNKIEGKERLIDYVKLAHISEPPIFFDIDSIKFTKETDMAHLRASVIGTNWIIDSRFKLNEYAKCSYIKMHYIYF
jgi:hypothetical protein